MGFKSYLQKIFGKKTQETKGESNLEIYARVYCQNCNTELTTQGGDITNTGRLYCHGDDAPVCLVSAIFAGKEGAGSPKQGIYLGTPVFGNFNNPPEIQKAISDGTLKEYGTLEEKLN